MFSWFSDIIRNYSEYQNPPIIRILWNTAMTYKIGTKALSAILDAMKLIRSPPIDSCSEYDPNDSCSKLPHIERGSMELHFFGRCDSS